jgi:hypothetical protein
MATTTAGAHGPNRSARAMAEGLGWFSIGLGLGELLAPRALARFLGLDSYAGVIQAYGAREVATGIGILTQADPTPWLWGRVAGDALDLATLAAGLSEERARTQNIGLALAAVSGVTVLDVICAQSLAEDGGGGSAGPIADYSQRRGMPRPPEQMRGVARDAPIARDMRTPEALRPYPASNAPSGMSGSESDAARPSRSAAAGIQKEG